MGCDIKVMIKVVSAVPFHLLHSSLATHPQMLEREARRGPVASGRYVETLIVQCHCIFLSCHYSSGLDDMRPRISHGDLFMRISFPSGSDLELSLAVLIASSPLATTRGGNRLFIE